MAFTRVQIAKFAGREVCSNLFRASNWTCSGTEGMMLSERLEPWLGLSQPLSHNTATRVYYWPEMTI